MGKQQSAIKRIAVVSHDYRLQDSRGFQDYSEHFRDINAAADAEGADTILYSLYSWDRESPVLRNYRSMFGHLLNVERIIFEVGKPRVDPGPVEVWLRSQQEPLVFEQKFGRSAEHPDLHKQFIDEMPDRMIDGALLVLCGEVNVVRVSHADQSIRDPFDVHQRLGNLGAGLVLNPWHDYSRRYESTKKRRYWSNHGRILVSVWNMGKGPGERRNPWFVLADGRDYTDQVLELDCPILSRPDIRVGMVDLEEIQHCMRQQQEPSHE